MKKISLTRGKYAIVDDEDYLSLDRWSWCASDSKNNYWYAKRGTHINGKPIRIYMHREIMRPPNGMDIDHINGNRLDNRRKNLRICTRADNIRNRTKLNKNNKSGICGVFFDKRSKKWEANIKINRKKHVLGFFSKFRDARAARKNWKNIIKI